MKFTARARAALLAGLLTLGLAPAARAVDLTVSAAASLAESFRELAPAFEAQHPGTHVVLNFAASDALLAQIRQGAPVDVFASADEATLDKAQAAGLLAAGTRHVFSHNALVLIVPGDARHVPKGLADLRDPAYARVALGAPAGVPAGRYAQGALQGAGLWDAVAPKAVFATNVRQALDYVVRGEVDAGFVYATDAQAFADKVRVVFDVATPTPIAYPLAVVEGSRAAELARAFADFVRSPAGQAVLARHGFRAP
ncbi:MAG: molybdate ABC transporter substrate-binding protein [Pelomonas sp.]|nr:molybdate ABC transporter substrate-binding protein [Roseateles sp.]